MVAVTNLTLLLFAGLTLLCFFASGADRTFSLDLADQSAQIALAVSIPVGLFPQVGMVMRMLDPKAVGDSPEITEWVRQEMSVLRQARRASLQAMAAEGGAGGAGAGPVVTCDGGDGGDDALVDIGDGSSGDEAGDGDSNGAGVVDPAGGRGRAGNGAKVVPTLGDV